MPLNKSQATQLIKLALPTGTVRKVIRYGDLYVFQVFRTDPAEEQMDPFYSVDMNTGNVKEFSVITDGNIRDIMKLFNKAQPMEEV